MACVVDRPDLQFVAGVRSAGPGRGGSRRRLILMGAGLAGAVLAFALTVRLGPHWAAGVLERRLFRGPGADGYLSVVVVGIDERAHDPGRTDTVVVASLRLEDGHVGALWVPRDTRVRLPGGSHNKVNLLFTAYGPRVMMKTLSELLGIPIDGYVRVDFQAFERFVDAIGGVEVTIPRRLRYRDRAQGLYIDLPAGTRRLSGEEALQFVRYRADGLGDISYDPGTGEYFGRVARQQEFARALAQAITRPRVLARLPRVLRETYAMVETDIPLEVALAVSAYVLQRRPLELATGVLPGMPGTVAGASYWLPDPARIPAETARVLGVTRAPGGVVVLNANGVPGAASRVAEALRAAGVRVERVGNAPSFGQAHSTVLASRDQDLALARRVAGALGNVPTVQRDPAAVARLLGEQGPAVVLLVGEDLSSPGGWRGASSGGEAAGVTSARQAGSPGG